jgi:hypothetical protein
MSWKCINFKLGGMCKYLHEAGAWFLDRKATA